ncbi:hypothetical protein BKA80DRAFT_33185 [Phyllosticta citrichinensis]
MWSHKTHDAPQLLRSTRTQTQLHRSTMNWTGGRLQRHSGPTKGHGDLAHRQRLHFAKARTQIYHAQPNPQNFVLASSDFFCSSPTNAHLSTKRPKILHQYETAATVAHHQRSAIRPAAAYYKASEAEIAGHGDQRYDDERTRTEVESPGNTSAEFSSARLKAEKARLLKSRDWVGLASSRPLHLAFASGREKEGIGKRHKVKRQKRFGHEGKRLYATTLKRAQERKDDGPYMSGAILDDDDIRIRIGTDALATQSLLDKNDSPGKNAPPAPSSDEMLFDVEARRETLRSQDDVFRGHTVELRNSKDEQANARYVADYCDAEHRPLHNTQPNDSDAPLADVDRLLQQLEETPSRFPLQHESSFNAAHALGSVHASPHELERDKVNYWRMHDDNVTMQSPDYEALGTGHNPCQAYGQGSSDSVTVERIPSPPSVHHPEGTLSPCALNAEGSKATLLEEDNKMRSKSSTAQPLLHEANGNADDDIAWRKFVQVNSDMADQSLDMQRSHCGNQGAHGGIQGSRNREIDESYHVHSGGIPTFTELAARPIGDGRRMHSGELEHEYHPTVRNVEGAATGSADRARSSNLRLQMPVSSAVAAVAKADFPAATSNQTDRFAKIATPRRGMISDTEDDAAEKIWKKFVLGSDLSKAECGECKSPKTALRSTAASIGASQNGSFSSLSVQASLNSASANVLFRSPEACLHSAVDRHHERAERAAAREVVKDSTDQPPMSMAVEGPGNATAAFIGTSRNGSTLDDAGDPGSSNVDFQRNQAVASDSIGHWPGHGKRIMFSKPKHFTGSTATSTPEYVKAGQENSSTGSAPHIGPLPAHRSRKWSLS